MNLIESNANHIIHSYCHLPVSLQKFQMTDVAPLTAVSYKFIYYYLILLFIVIFGVRFISSPNDLFVCGVHY